MACVDMASAKVDSEMEEGEIVDEIDYLSDISSEEEFLLRQRLKVLENYNNALERKEAKRSSLAPGKEYKLKESHSGLSDISSAEDSFLKTKYVITKDNKHVKGNRKQKKLKLSRKKKNQNKKKGGDLSSQESESDDDFVNKRRKLADAVNLSTLKSDTSTLKDRLTKMLCISKTENQDKQVLTTESECVTEVKDTKIHPEQINLISEDNLNNSSNVCTDEIIKTVSNDNLIHESVDSANIGKNVEINSSKDNSDEDLELLRQHALKTKSVKTKMDKIGSKLKSEGRIELRSDGEDSDTAELRMICLKSTWLKKAIEMKQKQKLQKRLSQSTNMHDFDICKPDLNVDNSTDVESVDMEIVSEGDDKVKELINDFTLKETKINEDSNNLRKEDEIEEDEDLLRAQLLTSLSKNLPNLVDVNVLDSEFCKEDNKKKSEKKPTPKNTAVEEKKFIIQLGDSDSETEHEATENLTKMHLKLSEQPEFQQKLDLFLKSTRLEVEKTKLPDVVQEPVPKPPEKFIPKTMNHLPKSEQIEYKNLVRRMAELEKMKQSRQNMINLKNKSITKDTLKPRNVSVTTSNIISTKKLEERIALSRKKIAEESAKMLKLKEEATKLSQRYKIVATEMKNIATAITINKKQQRTVQNGLTKIRNQHQMLLKSSPSKHSNQNFSIDRSIERPMCIVKSQKENEPLKDYKKPNNLKMVKVSVVNDLKNDDTSVNSRLSVQLDVTNNKKIIKLPKSPPKDRVVDINKHSNRRNEESNDIIESSELSVHTESNKDDNKKLSSNVQEEFNDYKSPLDALQCKNWEEDPNAVLCPFEFGGSCRDPDCKYLHPKIPT